MYITKANPELHHPTADGSPEPRRFQCRHIFTDGRRCGSPSLRDADFCYYHGNARRCGPRQPASHAQPNTPARRRSNTFNLPTPADLGERSGIQLALGQILHKIANNEIDPRRASLLLYGLQIASLNLGRDLRQPSDRLEEPVDEVIVDPELGTLATPLAVEDVPPPAGSVQALLYRLEERDRTVAEQAERSRFAALDARLAEEERWRREDELWLAYRTAPSPPAPVPASAIPTLQAATDRPDPPHPTARRHRCPGSRPAQLGTDRQIDVERSRVPRRIAPG